MDEKETGRLEAFSDGVFAVAITLLVLNIKVPGLELTSDKLPDEQTLRTILGSEWPMVAAYCTSFATIGIMWINHHRLFTHIKRVNTMLILINLMLLLVIVFIPVPTALLAEYLTRSDVHIPAVIYSSTCFLMAFCFNLLWRYASHHNRLLGRNTDPQAVAAISQQYMFGPLLYLVVFVISWISVPTTLIIIFLLALFFALPGRPLLALSNKKVKSSDTTSM